MGRDYSEMPTGNQGVRLNAGKSTESSLDMRSVENDAERESALRNARNDTPVAAHTAGFMDEFNERRQKSNADYQSRKTAEESEASIRKDQSEKDKQSYKKGGK